MYPIYSHSIFLGGASFPRGHVALGRWSNCYAKSGILTRLTQGDCSVPSKLGTTDAKNWDARFPGPPTKLARNNLLLAQLDQFWDLVPEPVLKQIREVLIKSDQPLAHSGNSMVVQVDVEVIEVIRGAVQDREPPHSLKGSAGKSRLRINKVWG